MPRVRLCAAQEGCEVGVGLDFFTWVFLYSRGSRVDASVLMETGFCKLSGGLEMNSLLPRPLSQALLFFQVSLAFCIKRTNTKQS